MKFTMEVRVGKNLLSITEECNNTQELFKKAGFFGTIPSECGNCKGDNLMLNHRKPQGKYDYYSVDCKDCGYRLNYGINQNEEETLFAKLRDGWEAPYRSEEEDSKPQSKTGSKLSALAKAKKNSRSEGISDEEATYENTPEEPRATPEKKTSRSNLLAKYKNKSA